MAGCESPRTTHRTGSDAKELVLIRDHRQITINAPPEKVFDLIETMPNKFPVYRILETKPFFFLRVLLVDGLRSAVKAAGFEKPMDIQVLHVGDSMGPFELTEVEKPSKYWFTLNSFFFNCRTGYTLNADEAGTKLNFILVADNPGSAEKLYWLLIKPVHILLARKVLKVIRKKVEL